MIPSSIIIHHSLTKDSKSVSWQAIRKYHIETLGWSDIGYHFGIELVNDSYEILSGRPMNVPGAHCKEDGMNYKSIGICVVGNFDEDEPPDKAWRLCLAVTSSLCHMFKIPIENVHGHRKHAHYKSCPGNKWDMEEFRAELKEVVI